MMNINDLMQFSLLNKVDTGHFILDLIVLAFLSALMSYMARNEYSFAQIGNICDYFKAVKPTIRTIKQTAMIAENGTVYDKAARGAMHAQESILYYINTTPNSVTNEINDSIITINTSNNTIMTQPAPNKWIKLSNNIELMIERNEDRCDKYMYTITTFILKYYNEDVKYAQRYLDNFISTCYADFLQNRYMISNAHRWMFVPTFDGEHLHFDQYKLHDSKKFDIIFHPMKNEIIKLIDDFENKRNKFAITGFPYKLGFLLYGKPGTGKTSLIKAISSHTKRHIMNISLSKIKTNQQLMDLMFSTRLSPTSKNEHMGEAHVSYDKLIYVLEDVDAISNIVKSREYKKDEHYSIDFESDDDSDDDHGKKSKKVITDRLTLAGLLNAIDGVIDTPGRILIMTTNHPEQLDPALIRPGRINKKINMDNIVCNDAKQMIRHYIGEFTTQQERAFDMLFKDHVFSPAFLESKCLDFGSIDDLLKWLEQEQDC